MDTVTLAGLVLFPFVLAIAAAAGLAVLVIVGILGFVVGLLDAWLEWGRGVRERALGATRDHLHL